MFQLLLRSLYVFPLRSLREMYFTQRAQRMHKGSQSFFPLSAFSVYFLWDLCVKCIFHKEHKECTKVHKVSSNSLRSLYVFPLRSLREMYFTQRAKRMYKGSQSFFPLSAFSACISFAIFA